MLLNLIITALLGATGVILLDKWGIDNYINTHPVWSRYWTAKPCQLCRAFWIGVTCYGLLLAFPCTVYVLLPFAAVPIQVILARLTTN